VPIAGSLAAPRKLCQGGAGGGVGGEKIKEVSTGMPGPSHRGEMRAAALMGGILAECYNRAPMASRLDRREALALLGGGALVAAGCNDDGGRRRSVTASETRGPGGPLSFNVHPLGGRFEALQRDALRRLTPTSIRVTLGLFTDTDSARAYTRAAPNLLGLVSDFRVFSLSAAEWPDLLEATLRRHPMVRQAELLNEPDRLYGLSPERYVKEFLRPGYQRIRERVPGVAVVAAAPSGDRRRAPTLFRRMTDAGADDFCDYRAVHVYFDDGGALSAIAGATRRPILVTETGTSNPSQHVRWYTDVVPRIRGALAAQEVYWYVLLESANLAAGTVPYSALGFSVIDSSPDGAGQARGAQRSDLYRLLTGLPLGRAR
jgi:hypothetical protein